MIVRYRIMQSRWEEDNTWEIWGIIYENQGGILRDYPILYSIEGDSFNDIVAGLEEKYLGYRRPEGLRRELAVLAESSQEYRLD